ncbi:cytidine deaminase [Pseudoalteromonas denitrificans]|uniref:Cytidine deaminase n=1 Tax=Pseudoalteromonas denitrificans DSM 6059 TaxID=1123010 RepID=A0A1I1FD77_9GAMM|nr:cytidine deaminase [Pseudoalteromonas denitrificans]SFB97231.1 cytidine deaminase [Pseudoalteromonas denitrificans DSM 6059]
MILSSKKLKCDFSPLQIDTIKAQLKTNSGMLPEKTVATLLEQHQVTIDILLTCLLPLAADFAVAPISEFKVGAIALGGSGNLYFGANLEFENQALSLVLHGEQSAVSNAWLQGEDKIKKIAINAAPCGYCRQFMNELACVNDLEILLDNTLFNFKAFLPMSFGPEDLGNNLGLLSKHSHGISMNDSQTVSAELLLHLNASYVPYSHNFSACEIKTNDGQVFYGRYAENAAYSPSLSPLQAAISQLILSGREFNFETIKLVTLVETAKIQNQISVTTAVLQSYDFQVPFNHILIDQ